MIRTVIWKFTNGAFFVSSHRQDVLFEATAFVLFLCFKMAWVGKDWVTF